ncbi:glycoside hydrolase family 43 protein [Ceratobasidium theobromae]|uniref:Glycoside hydrolase family 43 protein n=1 Tax=Ceratobasidium theobromae TaxID=1582974 RepID=A0A5N5QF80_9AGAM|nr:glycoside hydrolase family 43 protein [Ceratobasidium theobromae]
MVFLVVNPSYEGGHLARSVSTGTRRQPSSSRNSPSPLPRTPFPPEVIRLIISQVTRIPDLASCALVSRYSHNVATPFLYSALSFGPAVFRRNNVPGHSRGSGGYVSTSAEWPMGRVDVGSKDNVFDNRSSLCAETLSKSPHLLSFTRSISANLTVPNYAAAVRASRGQRTGDDQAFHEWATILSLPQASAIRHVAFAGVNDQRLLSLSTTRYLKLTALELSLPPPALPELSHLATFFQRQRYITHFASRNLADIKGLKGRHVPHLAHIDVTAALACQLAPGRPISTARIFPLASRRVVGLRPADELLMAIHALAQSTHSGGVVDLDISALWYSDHRMGDDCRAFFAAIRDSLQGLRRLRITLWSDLLPNNVDALFDCVGPLLEENGECMLMYVTRLFVIFQIMATLPALQHLETFEIRTWAEYGHCRPTTCGETAGRKPRVTGPQNRGSIPRFSRMFPTAEILGPHPRFMCRIRGC